MDEVDRYLNDVCWAMGGNVREQQAVRDELRAHIDDAVRELQMQGLAPSDARRAAVREFGAAEPLGRALRPSRGRRPRRQPVLLPDGAVLVEARPPRHLPHPAVVVMLALSAAASAAFVVSYLWPA